jgi:hypothetical protein
LEKITVNQVVDAPVSALAEVSPSAMQLAQQPQRQLTVVEYALQSGAPVAEVARLAELKIQMDQHEAVMRKLNDDRDRELRIEARAAAYAKAMAAFKAEAVRVVRSKERTAGPLKGSKYADLQAVVDAVTEAMSRHGLTATYRTLEDSRDWIRIACRVQHVDGHFEEVPFGGPIDEGAGRNSMQARKSSVTYLERFTLLMALGLAESDADDDGNGGGGGDTGPLLGDVWKWKAQKAETPEALGELWNQGVAVINKEGTRADYDTFKAAVFKRRAELTQATEGAAS